MNSEIKAFSLAEKSHMTIFSIFDRRQL